MVVGIQHNPGTPEAQRKHRNLMLTNLRDNREAAQAAATTVKPKRLGGHWSSSTESNLRRHAVPGTAPSRARGRL